MDVLLLSRLQFAITAAFHFIFVPLTLGLSILVAYMETRYIKTNDKEYLKMAKFWGKLFLINFALGIVTGITMEFQFGMNWSEYSKYVGDIFGSPLAVEATVAFFLESTFIGLWIFGWNKISRKLHAISMWIVAIATNLSALWILLANGWMQEPVGYILRNNRAEMVDFIALVTNPSGWLKFFHTVLSGYVLAAFFVMGISAYHLLKKNRINFFMKSFRIAAIFGLVSSLLIIGEGTFHAERVAQIQPIKFAAMESVWETQTNAPWNLLLFPDPDNEKNAIEAVGVPSFLSILAYHDANAKVKGLKEFSREERPPVTVTFFSFRIMVVLGFLFILLSALAVVFSKNESLLTRKKFLTIMLLTIPLPYIAGQLGWLVAEIGRQPWIVYGLLKTSDAVSKSVDTAQVVGSLIGFTLLYGSLAVVDIFLLTRYARKGPDDDLSFILKTSRS
jgi:cytochrome d ubiquinol oxidase subunit I